MGRIRTIKPEVVRSENIGKLSRDARLLFILLWTIVDDAGRSRAHSRMLASSLYPFDEPSTINIEAWLDELERTGCIRRYQVDGQLYLDIPKWLEHQKIDRPSKSHLPEYSSSVRRALDESSTNARSNRTVPYRKEGTVRDPSLRSDGEREIESARSLASALPSGALAHSPPPKQSPPIDYRDPGSDYRSPPRSKSDNVLMPIPDKLS